MVEGAAQVERDQLVRGGVNIEIARSRDYALLQRIATSEPIYRITSDDFSPTQGAWRLPQGEQFIYLLGQSGKQLLGFAAFYPVNGVTFETHLCFLSRGPVNQQMFARMLGWIWGATPAMRIIGAVPDYNRLAIKFAERAGFEVYGVNSKSWMKNGILCDQVCLGISRP